MNLRGPGQSELTLLRAKISNLESELEKKDTEIRGLKARVSVYRSRPVAQASARDPKDLTRVELEQGISAANKLGDTVTVARLYKELANAAAVLLIARCTH